MLLGNSITDGIIYYRTISPTLLRIASHRGKRNLSTVGKWLSISEVIIWFRKGGGNV